MSSNRIERSRSLESGVTPRRLNQVVLPDPGSPIASTTTPLGVLVVVRALCWAGLCSGGGTEGDSGWISVSILGSSTAVGVSTAASGSSCGASSYVGTMGSGWPSSTGGFCWPTLPVASDSFSVFFLRRFMRSRIQLRMTRVYHNRVTVCKQRSFPCQSWRIGDLWRDVHIFSFGYRSYWLFDLTGRKP